MIRKLEHSKKRLRTLVDKLQTVCHDTDPALLQGVVSPVLGPPINFANLQSLSLEQVNSARVLAAARVHTHTHARTQARTLTHARMYTHTHTYTHSIES